ncbi:E3 ubiquitin-protein ligase rnf181 [Phtheirospermum japonicum]|uniref:E3 ubiquitin-protein ligase rnf181 n=1 Tax=Phtheirospermum japonicum TaxID=374723 RepID=A0A830D7Q1_9LAMI|nr:E3 ubiquitin-protein ligase rnf181 [Phtheirospermum japonicum]
MANEIIQSYTEPLISSYKESLDLGFQPRVFIFEIQTNFSLNQGGGCLERHHGDFSHITYRLNEYLMPDDEIRSLIHEVFDFAEQITVVDSSIPAVPIVVEVDVWTVQLDGETLDDAIDRSVRPDRLIPLDLVRPEGWEKEDSCRPLRDYLLYGLPRIGVEDEGFGARMETCPICLGGPTAAAPMSLLPCNHAFHRHCVVRWILKSWSCPLCRHEIAHEILKEGDGRN